MDHVRRRVVSVHVICGHRCGCDQCMLGAWAWYTSWRPGLGRLMSAQVPATVRFHFFAEREELARMTACTTYHTGLSRLRSTTFVTHLCQVASV